MKTKVIILIKKTTTLITMTDTKIMIDIEATVEIFQKIIFDPILDKDITIDLEART